LPLARGAVNGPIGTGQGRPDRDESQTGRKQQRGREKA
jgi:hypothetical protein